MTNPIERALASIATETSADNLMTFARNARGKSPEVERAALRRLAAVSARHAPGTVEHRLLDDGGDRRGHPPA